MACLPKNPVSMVHSGVTIGIDNVYTNLPALEYKMKECHCSLAVLLIGLCITWQSAIAKTIHVSPDGNDAWTGKLDHPNADRSEGPVATLTRARDIIRGWKSFAPLDQPVHVVLADGVYSLTQPFVLTPQDSGTKSCPISYERAPGASPVISGGRTIGGFRPAADGIWQAEIPDVAAG